MLLIECMMLITSIIKISSTTNHKKKNTKHKTSILALNALKLHVFMCEMSMFRKEKQNDTKVASLQLCPSEYCSVYFLIPIAYR